MIAGEGSPPNTGVALVGLGHVAAHHLAALETTAGLELRIACDLNPERARALPPGVPFTADLDTVLADPDVALILVAVPPSAHVDVAGAALGAGRDVALEKPLAPNPEALARLVALAGAEDGPQLYPLLHAAHGLETDWFAREWAPGRSLADLGPLHGFGSHFYDPYVEAGGCRAPTLGGSWIDSAINALSVLDRFLDANSLEVEHASMTRSYGVDPPQVQGSAVCRFRAGDGSLGRGLIDTNWTLGVNRKVTRLFFDRGQIEVRLDHSRETVERVDGYRNSRRLASLHGETPRLTAHYQGAFRELVARRTAGRSGLTRALTLHRTVFAALERPPGDLW